MNLYKILVIFFYFLFFVNKYKAYDFDIVSKEIITIKYNLKCFKEQYVYFKENIYQICLYFLESEHKYNIYVNRISNLKDNINITKLFPQDISKYVIYYFTFTTENSFLILYFLNTRSQNIESFIAQSIDGVHFDIKKTNFSYNFLNKWYIFSYSSTSIQLFKKEHIFVCGKLRDIFQINKMPYISCIGSYDNGINWKTQIYFYYDVNRYNNNNYILFYLKKFGNEIGFTYLASESSNNRLKYIKCWYISNYSFNCSDVNLDINTNGAIKTISKIKGFYLVIKKIKDRKYNCLQYYIYKSLIYSEFDNICSHEHIVNANTLILDDSSIFINFLKLKQDEYLNENILMHYKGSIKHCIMLFSDNNPGFIQENDKFTCEVNYTDLVEEKNYNFFALSVIKPLKDNIKECFQFSYDSNLNKINIFSEFKTVSSYATYRTYIFYINKELEKSIYYNVSILCNLESNYYVKINLDYIDTYILDNKLDYSQEFSSLSENQILYYNIPDNEQKDTLIYLKKTRLPIGTTFVKEKDKYILVLPNYIESSYTTTLNVYFDNKWIYKDLKIIKTEKNDEDKILIDFSKTINKNIYDHIDKNQINIQIDTSKKSTQKLVLICPITKGYEMTCFNDLLVDNKKIFYKNVFYDLNLHAIVFPFVYLYTENINDQIYVQSTLKYQKKTLQKNIEGNTGSLNKGFSCNCFYDNALYTINFKFN